jgi:oxygen-dependent protoporphyrinogen oxidase
MPTEHAEPLIAGDDDRPRVAVVGAGASGLAAAHRLDRAGFRVELIERAAVLGGRFGVSRLGDRPVMMGGKNIGRRYTAFRAFTTDLGDHPYEPFGINASRIKDDQVQTIDSTHRLRSLRTLLGAGSPPDLLRLIALAIRVRRDDASRFLGSPLFTKIARRSDGKPLSEHFGGELTRYLLRPMTVRTNGAEPDEVYLGTFGTNLALLMDTYDQLRDGIEPVLDALAERITVRTSSIVEGLVVRDGAVAGLRISERGGPAVEHEYAGVVVATAAAQAGAILAPDLPALAGRLSGVRYFPSTVALVEYDRTIFTPQVRAIAMDDGPCSNAGAYGSDDRQIVRYTFSGRDARLPDPSDAQIAAWIDEGESRLMRYVPSAAGAGRVCTVTRHWSSAYCAYVPFHGEFLDKVKQDVASLPSLELAGDYLLGASIEACCRSGEQAAVALATQLPATARTRRPVTAVAGRPGWAVVTGASSGIGAALARGLAGRGYAVLLVARRAERLERLAAELSTAHGVELEVWPCDLADPADRARLGAELGAREVAVLCNNAGFATCGPICDADRDREAEELAVNVVALHELTLAALPAMLERRAGAILVTGSTAGEQPVPTAATYSASKAFANTFAQALHEELLDTGVSCTLLEPGPVRTEFATVGGIGHSEATRWFAWEAADRVAEQALDGLERRRRVVVPGPLAPLSALAGRHAPRALASAILRAIILPRLRAPAPAAAKLTAWDRGWARIAALAGAVAKE